MMREFVLLAPSTVSLEDLEKGVPHQWQQPYAGVAVGIEALAQQMEKDEQPACHVDDTSISNDRKCRNDKRSTFWTPAGEAAIRSRGRFRGRYRSLTEANQGGSARRREPNLGGCIRMSESDANSVSVLSRDKCSRTVWFPLIG